MTRWPTGVPTAETLEAARRTQQRNDALKPNRLDNIASEAQRLEGHVAEALFASWLGKSRAPYSWDGGPNPRPDFIVYGEPVAFRTTAVRGSTLSGESIIYIFEAHAKGTSARFFGGIDREAGRYYLLGAVPLARFLETGWRVAKGEQLCPGFIARHPMRANRVRALKAPDAWLARMADVAMAQQPVGAV